MLRIRPPPFSKEVRKKPNFLCKKELASHLCEVERISLNHSRYLKRNNHLMQRLYIPIKLTILLLKINFTSHQRKNFLNNFRRFQWPSKLQTLSRVYQFNRLDEFQIIPTITFNYTFKRNIFEDKI